MRLPTFIGLENSLDKALNYYNSPQMKHYSFEGVHLLPNHIYPYKQRTYATEGIELESWEHVYIVDLCGNRLEDIATYFDVVDNYNDTPTGLPQIIWQIKNCPFDAGYQPVYLEIISGANAPIYSSVFYFTNIRGEFTTRIDYKDKSSEEMLSTSLVMYYHTDDDEQTVSNYTAVSPGRAFNASSIVTPFEWFKTGVIDIKIFRALKNIFTCRYVYTLPANFDGYPVRTSLREAIETPRPEADENFGEAEIALYRNYDQTYNPNALPIVPPPPPVDPPVITITKLNNFNNTGVQYIFTTENYNTLPPEFIYEYSLDQVTWQSVAGDTSSPTVITGMDVTQPYYYRIYDYTTGTYSNVVQLAQPSITIDLVSSGTFIPGQTQSHIMFFTIENYTPTNTILAYSSANGTTWSPAVGASSNASPKTIITVPSVTAHTYFKMVDTQQGIESNIYHID